MNPNSSTSPSSMRSLAQKMVAARSARNWTPRRPTAPRTVSVTDGCGNTLEIYPSMSAFKRRKK